MEKLSSCTYSSPHWLSSSWWLGNKLCCLSARSVPALANRHQLKLELTTPTTSIMIGFQNKHWPVWTRRNSKNRQSLQNKVLDNVKWNVLRVQNKQVQMTDIIYNVHNFIKHFPFHFVHCTVIGLLWNKSLFINVLR